MTRAERIEAETRIAGEICARILEWRELAGPDRPTKFLVGFSNLAAKNSTALNIACEMVAGENHTLTRRFADLGARVGITRQAAHFRVEKALRIIRTEWPAIAPTLRTIAARHPGRPTNVMRKHASIPREMEERKNV